MSFLSGPECSTSNPLSQLQKQFQTDRTSQQNGFGGNVSSSSAPQGFRTTPVNTGAQDERLHRFLNHAPAMQEMALDRPDLSKGMDLRAQSASPVWSSGSGVGGQHTSMAPAFSADEFARFQALSSQPQRTQASPAPAAQFIYNERPILGPGLESGYMPPGGMMRQRNFYRPPNYMSPALQHNQSTGRVFEEAELTGKGKGKEVVEDRTDWEEAFTRFDLGQEQEANLAQEAELDQTDREILEGETGFGDFESVWQGMKVGENENGYKWDDDEDFTFNTNNLVQPALGGYEFEENNVFKDLRDVDTQQIFEQGVQLMDSGGNLTLASLAFETVVQREPKHIEAWVRLGNAQAQNEKEEAALRALERARELDPANLEAIMGLAVSYTNEGYDSYAYSYLDHWLTLRYPQIPGSTAPDLSSTLDQLSSRQWQSTSRSEHHQQVTDRFIAAAQLSPDGQHMDPDVQVGLGVLFYGSNDFDKAVDCFQAALASSEAGLSTRRNQIHLLWNRLGATLANSGRSEEAIAAYERALELNPGFVRARYNLGVSCMNIGCYEEAAAHMLRALQTHEVGVTKSTEDWQRLLDVDDPVRVQSVKGRAGEMYKQASVNPSTTLYDTLRRVITMMGRTDLAEKVEYGVRSEVFASEIKF